MEIMIVLQLVKILARLMIQIISSSPTMQVLLGIDVASAYPLKDYDLANLVGVLAVQKGWYPDYLETIYRLWFVAGLAAGSE